MVDILQALLDKQELRGVSHEFAKRLYKDLITTRKDLIENAEEKGARYFKTKQFDELKKIYRAQLREVYGVFFTAASTAKRNKAITQLMKETTKENSLAVLDMHRSTKERIDHYDFLYEQIFEHTGKPESILDLGCGYNPFSYPFLGCTPRYYCADIACQALTSISEFLSIVSPKSRTFCVDLTDEAIISSLPQADIVFALKLFDSLETLKRGVTETILNNLDAKYLIVSFPTQSIGGKQTLRTRTWFEALITDKEKVIVTLPNEQLYIITL